MIPDPVTAAVGAVLPKLRQVLALSQTDLAIAMHSRGASGWSRTTVAKLEGGKRAAITAHEVVLLADVFNLDVMRLLDPERCRKIRVLVTVTEDDAS